MSVTRNMLGMLCLFAGLLVVAGMPGLAAGQGVSPSPNAPVMSGHGGMAGQGGMRPGMAPAGPGAGENEMVPPPGMAPAGPMMAPQSCQSQWQSCMDGCNGISPRQRGDIPNCVRNCETIRAGCR